MSTLLYGTITRKREEAAPGTSTRESSPNVSTFVDVLSALVPAEVLAIHALVIGYATSVSGGTTTITAPDQLRAWFFILAGAPIVLYLFGLKKAVPTGWDWVRMFIPSLAFIGWSMLQRSTVFDGLAPNFDPNWRWTIGLALALFLGAFAAALGNEADASDPARTRTAVSNGPDVTPDMTPGGA